MQGWKATTKHEVFHKKKHKKIKAYTKSVLFRKNLQLKGVC